MAEPRTRRGCSVHLSTHLLFDALEADGSGQFMCAEGYEEARPKQTYATCEPVLLVESRDGDGRLLGMLAADQCSHCRGKGTIHVEVTTPPFGDSGDYPCESCGGRGFRLREGDRA